MNALGMVILSHMRSRTSSPDSGEAMAFTMAAMSLWMDKWKSSRPVNVEMGPGLSQQKLAFQLTPSSNSELTGQRTDSRPPVSLSITAGSFLSFPKGV